jgi:hypothetical protein
MRTSLEQFGSMGAVNSATAREKELHESRQTTAPTRPNSDIRARGGSRPARLPTFRGKVRRVFSRMGLFEVVPEMIVDWSVWQVAAGATALL